MPFRTQVLAVAGVALALLAPVTGSAQETEPFRVLIYGDSNSWGYKAVEGQFESTRFAKKERYTEVLAKELGPDYEIVVDGLNGRTTDLDLPEGIGNLPATAFNGARHLPQAIAREMPLDLVVIALGANDLQNWAGRSAEDVAAAAVSLAKLAEASRGVATSYQAPRALLVSPASLNALPPSPMEAFFAEAALKSQNFITAFKRAGAEADVPVFDAGAAIGVPDGADGLHFSVEDHQQLGQALTPIIIELRDGE